MTTTDRAEADLVRRLAERNRNPLGPPPIPAAPVPLWWIFAGWGGYALGILAFGLVIVIASW